MIDSVLQYLDLLDSQREAAFAALDGLTEEQIWQRPAPREWCIGEILDHNVRLFVSMLPGLHFGWAALGWYGRLRRNRPYLETIENIYKRPSFPMRISFLWTPKYNPRKAIPLAALKIEMESAHARIHAYYTGKDQAVLGNIYGYDPAVGIFNLIQALKVSIDHDQLHFDDVIKMAVRFKGGQTG
ncbi:MAG: DinB family protein [Chloroflexi bacterium]|nr:DinB family protein [Chloroflexota bacterium]